ncbi:hypothetical protein CPB84DRAFT_1815387 [Gymnopilus junonius]|uniref:Uncharacterized protein n=1 Tax=Gymnopilus junonius TaxID=109634 RepID=A0A9P5TNA5_GYMJU|nr:hypothetical protein CPB84DRAFT_1815387 [Gymnopilus junonius]
MVGSAGEDTYGLEICTQRISTTLTPVFKLLAHLSSSSSDNGAKKYIENLYRATRNPLWHLLDTLHARTDGVYPYNALHDNYVSMENFKKWERVLSQVDIEAAVATLLELGYQVAGFSSSSSKAIPSWVVLSLVRFKVKSAAHADGPLMDLVFTHIGSAASDVKAPLLILTAYQLGRFNLLLPLRRVLHAFLEFDIPIESREQQYNAFLHALSTITFRSVENANNVNAVLKKMDELSLKLSSSTYDALLRDQFATFLLAKSLFVRMVDEGRTPTYYQLESVLRVFTEQGQMDLAERFFDAIHLLAEEPIVEAAKNPRIRANALMLNSFQTRKKAAKYTHYPVAPEDGHSTSPNVPPSVPQGTGKGNGDIYAQTAAFHVAAKDLSTATSHLFGIFNSLPGEPNIVTYTILIRGLLARREFRKADIFFSKLSKTKRRDLVMDIEALTAGVQAYTRNGKPHEAFHLLEKYAVKPELNLNGAVRKTEDGDGDPSLPKVEITTISVNEFLVALNRSERPDVVFRLWDHMGTLYAVQPNSTTLSILLQGARLAYRKDDSLAGVVAKLKMLNPFKSTRSKYSDSERFKRVQAVDEVISCVGHPSRGGLRKYTDGMWRGLEPVEYARKVFLQVLWGNDAQSPGGGRLSGVESPADATRIAYDDDASSSLGIPDLAPKKFTFHPPPDLLTPAGKSYYPSIIITNNNFFNYIALLGVSSRANEIPLTLAWMRELGVQPSESTLAMVLVLWFEVSAQAPLVEKWSGRDEYWRLRNWVAEWVGEKRVPGDEVLG